jgi:ABC-type sugar transport system ATPase subunit
MRDISLRVAGLSLTQGATRLGPISFLLPHAGCWWLTGVSGAGKSLLMESLAGFHAEATGSIELGAATDSREVAGLAPEHRSIALMPQRWRLFPHWTVIRNLQFAAKLSATPRIRIMALAARLQVADLLERPTRALSGGETQRIVLLQTLLSPARVLLLDEPLSAIDAALQSVVLDLAIQEAVQDQRIFLIAAHRSSPSHPMQGEFQIEMGQLTGHSETSENK